jgi:hypothetical protein
VLIALIAAGGAWASGWPPFSRDDFAVVARGGTVTVLEGGAASVLANDFDLENDTLSAFLTRDVKEGTLTLRQDGTFVYTHNGNNKDKDEFRYVAFDGTGFSREAKVRIDINEVPNNPPTTVGSPGNQTAIANRFYSLSLAQYFTDIDPDDVLRFSASGLPSGNRLAINSTTGVLSGTPGNAVARDLPYNVRITATDTAGASASLEFALTIIPDNRADLELSASVAVNPVTVGEAARWNIKVNNLGPAALSEGELVAQWATSGPTMSLTAPPGCTISGNNSRTPAIRCAIATIVENESDEFAVQGVQSAHGDNSLIAIAVADDPNQANNATLSGAVVVTAFSEGPAQVINSNAVDIVADDLNGDGAADVVVSGEQTTIYFNSGNRTLITPGVALGSGSGGGALALLDWNGDTHLDIAVGGLDSVAGRIYLNDGSGNFASQIDLNIGGMGTVNAAAAADFDLDGSDELVLGGTGDVLLLRASGGAAFAKTTLPASSAVHISVADINNDSFPDIVVVQTGARQIRVLRNAGDGRSFASQSLDRGSVAAATPADFDGDGDIDLLLAVDDGELEVPESKVVFQLSGNTFSAGSSLGASPLTQLLAGDIDQDGVHDAIAVNASGVHQIYRGLPAGGISLHAEQIVSSGMRRGVLLDFNGDDSLDLILAGPGAGVVEIHANNGIGKLGLGDRIAPSITLNGAPSLPLAVGETYEELGATATDNIDGDLTDQITISGAVNTSVVGTYRITYTATDRARNKASVQRTIQVGVNQGKGGGGGGAAGPWFVLFLALLATKRRRAGLPWP